MRFWPGKPNIHALGMQKYLRELSGVVWREQNNAYRAGLNLQEETITECLLLQMARDLPKAGFRVKLFTREREKDTGADWVWFFKQGRCRVGFRVQAKKLYRRHDRRPGRTNQLMPGRYDGHVLTKGQTKTLIKRAGPNNPIYVFYNHDHVKNRQLFRQVSSGFKPPSFWGCSVASASFVERKKSRALSILHPGMRPLHELFQYGPGCGLANGLNLLDPDMETKMHDGDPDWVRLQESTTELQSYLMAENLNGIAYFDASEVGEDFFVPR
ncbi:MAG: DUF6615 family protein [Geminicoccales bacterium]|uniref:DUF6615 family protein n=1 Tax=Planktotalea sp. TaxID=2029877 RepID=UPI003D6B5431